MKDVNVEVGRNTIRQKILSSSEQLVSVDTVVSSWENALSLTPASETRSGLRTAQLGALFAIKSHWTVSREPATIVMPTGTGKTEAMIAAIVSEKIKRTLIVVPSNLLRKQTSEKFQKFGILRDIGVIDKTAHLPSVTILKSTPSDVIELNEILFKSNVVVTTMALLQKFSDAYLTSIRDVCDAFIVDEAHHIAAKTWATTKYKLLDLRCLQFTATPFRNDGKKVDGKIIYNFPLHMAQEQGYFKPIQFLPIMEFNEQAGDLAIASEAVAQLEKDLLKGFNHIILVRSRTKQSATRLYEEIYFPNFPKYNPVLIHSGIKKIEQRAGLEALRSGESRIVVCVDMFGEGIDIPNLKIAAIHDKHKSLPITLQFVGRFARTQDDLGPATVVTNIANDELNDSIQELYSRDSDWNIVLRVMSEQAVEKELHFQEFEAGFDRNLAGKLSLQQLRPTVRLVAYHVPKKKWNLNSLIKNTFEPGKFFFSVNQEQKVIIIIEHVDSRVDWTSFRGLSDSKWELHLLYWNQETQMLYVNSTNKSFSDTLARTLFPEATRISGENVFRCLHGMKRLMLGTVGLNSAIDGPIRYRMFAGMDIGRGISESQKENTYKSNIFGTGYRGNGRISIGCSYKGRIWSRWVEKMDYWMNWCNEIGELLMNEDIDTKSILTGALIPEIVTERPNHIAYGIEWPIDIDLISDNSVYFLHGPDKYAIYDMEIGISEFTESGPLKFFIRNSQVSEEYELLLLDNGYSFRVTKPSGLCIRRRKSEYKMTDFFKEYPPLVKFVNRSMLEGNVLVKIGDRTPPLNPKRIEAWGWSNTNIRKESQGLNRDPDSIQFNVIQRLLLTNKYSVIFDDDDSGEIADIIGIIDEGDKIVIQFYHCKYSSEDKPGSRVADLYEVCGQAEKSVRWCQDPRMIIDRLVQRESKRLILGHTRFELGDIQKLKEIKNKMRFYRTTVEIFIVQPGVDSSALTDPMLRILASTASSLMDTYGIDLRIIAS